MLCKWHYRGHRAVVTIGLWSAPLNLMCLSSCFSADDLLLWGCGIQRVRGMVDRDVSPWFRASPTFDHMSASWTGGNKKPPQTNLLQMPCHPCHDGQDPLNCELKWNSPPLSCFPWVLSQSEPQSSRAWGNVGLTWSPHELLLFAVHTACASFLRSVWRAISYRKDCTKTRASESCFVPTYKAQARQWLSGGEKTPWWMFQWLLSKMIREHIKSLAETLLPADFTMQAMKFVAEAK